MLNILLAPLNILVLLILSNKLHQIYTTSAVQGKKKTSARNTYQYAIKKFMYKETKDTDYKTQQMQQ